MCRTNLSWYLSTEDTLLIRISAGIIAGKYNTNGTALLFGNTQLNWKISHTADYTVIVYAVEFQGVICFSFGLIKLLEYSSHSLNSRRIQWLIYQSIDCRLKKSQRQVSIALFFLIVYSSKLLEMYWRRWGMYLRTHWEANFIQIFCHYYFRLKSRYKGQIHDKIERDDEKPC